MNFVTRQTKVSEVSSWDEVYSSDTGTVWYANNFVGYYKTILDGKTKYFKGETAWSDVERYFHDAGDWACNV